MKKSKLSRSKGQMGMATDGKIKTGDKGTLFKTKSSTFQPGRAASSLKLMPEDLKKAAKEQEDMVTASGRPHAARKVS